MPKKTVSAYIKTLSKTDATEAKVLLDIFSSATKVQPQLWGSMIGYGIYHYQYESGREGDCFATGFAIRKSGPTIYIMPGYANYDEILKNLGPHKLGKSCLYIKSTADIHLPTLKKLIKAGLKDLAKKYPVTMQ